MLTHQLFAEGLLSPEDTSHQDVQPFETMAAGVRVET